MLRLIKRAISINCLRRLPRRQMCHNYLYLCILFDYSGMVLGLRGMDAGCRDMGLRLKRMGMYDKDFNGAFEARKKEGEQLP